MLILVTGVSIHSGIPASWVTSMPQVANDQRCSKSMSPFARYPTLTMQAVVAAFSELLESQSYHYSIWQTNADYHLRDLAIASNDEGDEAGDVEGEEQRDRIESVAEIVHGIGEESHAAAGDVDDDLQGGGGAEGGQGDPDGADGELVIEEGAVGGEVGVAVVVGEAGQVQGGGELGEGVGAVMVVVGVGHGACSAGWLWRDFNHKDTEGTKIFSPQRHRGTEGDWRGRRVVWVLYRCVAPGD